MAPGALHVASDRPGGAFMARRPFLDHFFARFASAMPATSSKTSPLDAIPKLNISMAGRAYHVTVHGSANNIVGEISQHLHRPNTCGAPLMVCHGRGAHHAVMRQQRRIVNARRPCAARHTGEAEYFVSVRVDGRAALRLFWASPVHAWVSRSIVIYAEIISSRCSNNHSQ